MGLIGGEEPRWQCPSLILKKPCRLPLSMPGVDGAVALGYGNTSAALHKHVDDDDRMPINLNTVTKRDGITGNPRVSCITESGLYSLIWG